MSDTKKYFHTSYNNLQLKQMRLSGTSSSPFSNAFALNHAHFVVNSNSIRKLVLVKYPKLQNLCLEKPLIHTLITHYYLCNLSNPPPSTLPVLNWPVWTAGHAVLHGLDEVIISRPLTTSKINSFWNGHNGGLTCRDISIISSSPPLSSLSPLGTGRVWFILGLIRGGDLPTGAAIQACPQSRAQGAITFNLMQLWNQVGSD